MREALTAFRTEGAEFEEVRNEDGKAVDRRLVSSHPKSMWIMSEKVALADERVARILLLLRRQLA